MTATPPRGSLDPSVAGGLEHAILACGATRPTLAVPWRKSRRSDGRRSRARAPPAGAGYLVRTADTQPATTRGSFAGRRRCRWPARGVTRCRRDGRPPRVDIADRGVYISRDDIPTARQGRHGRVRGPRRSAILDSPALPAEPDAVAAWPLGEILRDIARGGISGLAVGIVVGGLGGRLADAVDRSHDPWVLRRPHRERQPNR